MDLINNHSSATPLKILFIGDFSGYHAAVGQKLSEMGHHVTIASDGSTYMNTFHDIYMGRGPGLKGTLEYLILLARRIPSFKGYDVVQLINPHFLYLKPEKFKFFFNILKRNNRSIFLSFAGDDVCFMNACVNTDMFRFSEYRIGKKPTQFDLEAKISDLLTSPAEVKAAMHIYENIDGGMAALPEYDMAARAMLGDKICFTNLPISPLAFPAPDFSDNKKICLFVGLKGGKEVQKGTAYLLDMAKRLEKNPELDCEVVSASNLSLADYLQAMAGSHIVLDQLYSYSPAMNALQAMSMGCVAASGAQPEFYRYIREDSRPVIPLSPLDDDASRMEYFKNLILDRERLRSMSADGRNLVKIHNDPELVAGRFLKHWYSVLSHK